jgi:Spy/CpxP family protein refolding chaperone
MCLSKQYQPEDHSMKKYGIVTAIVVVVLGAALALHAEAKFRHASQTWGGPPMAGRFLQHMADVLDLTDAQQGQIKQMWQAELPTIQPLVQQLAEQHKQMVAATQGGRFNEAQVRPIANQQAQVIAQLIVEKQKLQSQVYAILTPDQQAKMARLQQRHMDRMQNWLNKQTTNQQ